jgi:hypothetical protein
VTCESNYENLIEFKTLQPPNHNEHAWCYKHLYLQSQKSILQQIEIWTLNKHWIVRIDIHSSSKNK